MVSKIFGSKGSVSVGAPQLPAFIQDIYDVAKPYAQKFLDNPEQYFAPSGLSEQEQMVGGLLANPFTDPAAYGRSLNAFMSPYRDIITQDINKQFEAPQSALSARASEAGAFGSSRHRGAQSDLERARLDAIANAMQGQYNTAQGQYTSGLSNLLNFGGMQRELDLQRRQAPVSAFETYMGGLTPLLSSQTYNPVTVNKGSSGLLGGLSNIMGAAPIVGQAFSGLGSAVGGISGLGGFGSALSSGLGGIGSFLGAFSDRRLKKNIKRVGELMGLPMYVFEYLWSPDKVVGFMADEVEKLYPDAVSEKDGYKMVNYGAIAWQQ